MRGPVSVVCAGCMSEPTYETYRPPVRRQPEDPVEVRRERRFDRGALECFLGPSAICVAIWLLTGAGYFWPAWVMLGTGVPVLLSLPSASPAAAGDRRIERAAAGVSGHLRRQEKR